MPDDEDDLMELPPDGIKRAKKRLRRSLDGRGYEGGTRYEFKKNDSNPGLDPPYDWVTPPFGDKPEPRYRDSVPRPPKGEPPTGNPKLGSDVWGPAEEAIERALNDMEDNGSTSDKAKLAKIRKYLAGPCVLTKVEFTTNNGFVTTWTLARHTERREGDATVDTYCWDFVTRYSGVIRFNFHCLTKSGANDKRQVSITVSGLAIVDGTMCWEYVTMDWLNVQDGGLTASIGMGRRGPQVIVPIPTGAVRPVPLPVLLARAGHGDAREPMRGAGQSIASNSGLKYSDFTSLCQHCARQ